MPWLTATLEAVMELRKPWSAAGIWSHVHCRGRTCHPDL